MSSLPLLQLLLWLSLLYLQMEVVHDYKKLKLNISDPPPKKAGRFFIARQEQTE
jgi:hypothetical protein